MYRNIADELREQIVSGDLAAGSRLPSETELMKRHGVSRVTARQAFDVLRHEGLIDVRQGSRAIVRPTSKATADHLVHRTAVYDSTERISAAHDLPADSDLAVMFDVPEGTPLYTWGHVTIDTDNRITSQRTYLPADPAPATTDNIVASLIARGHHLEHTEHVSASMPSPQDTTDLDIPPGIPMLTIRRLTRDVTGQVLMIEDTRLPAESTLVYRIPSGQHEPTPRRPRRKRST